MKLLVEHPHPARYLAQRSQGFTLIEAMIATTLMVGSILGTLIAANLMGLREQQLLESKAGASDSARRNISQLKNDIYGAKGWQVGNSDNTGSFQAVTNGALQGNALAIFPLIITSNQIVDPNVFNVYFFDSSDSNHQNGVLRLIKTNGVHTIVISNLIPPMTFKVEDYRGIVVSNRSYKNVIHTTFQYAQFQYPLTKVGTNYLFNSYRIDVRATPHLPDGP